MARLLISAVPAILLLFPCKRASTPIIPVDAELCHYRRNSVSPGGFGNDPCLVLNPLAEEQLWRDMGIFILRILWQTEDEPYISTVGMLLGTLCHI